MTNTIILLHGALGSKSNLNELKDLLSLECNVFSFNFEGHGGEPLPTDGLSMPRFAENIAKFIDENGISNPSIFGYSMGGYAALKYISNHKNKVKNLITLGTKFDWSNTSTEKAIASLNLSRWQQHNPVYVAELIRLHHPTDLHQFIEATKEMLKQISLHDFLTDTELNSISSKVYIMLGDQDKMVSVEESLSTHLKIKNSEFILLKDTKHPLEQVNALALCAQITKIMNSTS